MAYYVLGKRFKKFQRVSHLLWNIIKTCDRWENRWTVMILPVTFVLYPHLHALAFQWRSSKKLFSCNRNYNVSRKLCLEEVYVRTRQRKNNLKFFERSLDISFSKNKSVSLQSSELELWNRFRPFIKSTLLK